MVLVDCFFFSRVSCYWRNKKRQLSSSSLFRMCFLLLLIFINACMMIWWFVWIFIFRLNYTYSDTYFQYQCSVSRLIVIVFFPPYSSPRVLQSVVYCLFFELAVGVLDGSQRAIYRRLHLQRTVIIAIKWQ